MDCRNHTWGWASKSLPSKTVGLAQPDVETGLLVSARDRIPGLSGDLWSFGGEMVKGHLCAVRTT